MSRSTAARLYQLVAVASMFAAVLGFGSPSQELNGPSLSELAVLPPYCRAQPYIYVQDQDAPQLHVTETERQRWRNIIGEDFIHLHHYCWALTYVNRANKSPDEAKRGEYLRRAVAEIDYVQRNASPALAILPEIGVRKGLVLRLLGEDETAVKEFRDAIELRPSYPPAYIALSDYHLEQGDIEKAHKVLQEGLQHSSKSRLLSRKLAEVKARLNEH